MTPSGRPGRPNPAKDFPPLVLIALGFPLAAVGAALMVLGEQALQLIGAVVLVFAQLLVIVGTVAQGVYLGIAKAQDRGLL